MDLWLQSILINLTVNLFSRSLLTLPPLHLHAEKYLVTAPSFLHDNTLLNTHDGVSLSLSGLISQVGV